MTEYTIKQSKNKFLYSIMMPTNTEFVELYIKGTTLTEAKQLCDKYNCLLNVVKNNGRNVFLPKCGYSRRFNIELENWRVTKYTIG